MPRVLYLSYDGITDPLGQSQILPYIIGLSKRGYSFTLISFDKVNRLKDKQKLIAAQLTDYPIKWIPLIYHKRPAVVSTLYDLFLLRQKANSLMKQNRYEIVHCRSYLTMLIGLHLKKKYRTKLVFDMRGFWADERVEGGIWNVENLVYNYIYQYFKYQEKQFLKQADCIISLTQSAKEEMGIWERTEGKFAPIEVIPCCADLGLFDRKKVAMEQVSLVKNELGIMPEHLTLLYLGSIGTWYMLKEMLAFYGVLLQYRPKSRFLIITRDSPKQIRVLAKRMNIPIDKLIITSAERDALPSYVAVAHLSVFFIRPVFSKKASSPTKQGELMAMGIPIICNAGVGDTAKIIQKTEAGAVIANFTTSSYQSICENLDRILAIPEKEIRSGAQQFFSLENGVESYSQVYEKLLCVS